MKNSGTGVNLVISQPSDVLKVYQEAFEQVCSKSFCQPYLFLTLFAIVQISFQLTIQDFWSACPQQNIVVVIFKMAMLLTSKDAWYHIYYCPV